MKVIGITGGIGTGKSTASGYLRKLGYDVIDADEIAHDMAGDEKVLSEIRDFFGDGVIGDDRSLDRKRMAEIVFSDVRKKEILESIITSRVIAKVGEIIGEYRSGNVKPSKDDVLFLDAPTLLETGADRLVDEVWLVTCDMDVRLYRASLRDGTSRDRVEARIAAQIPEDEKIERADVVIYNNGTREELFRTIDQYLRIMQIAKHN